MGSDPRPVAPSAGLLTGRLGADTVVCDLVAETTHLLGPLEAWLVTLEQPAAVPDLVDDLVDATGAARPEAEARLALAIDELRARGLLDRAEGPEPAPPAPGSPLPADGRPTGLVHSVVDHRIAFRSGDPGLLDEVDAFLDDGVDGEPSLVLDLEPAEDGGVTLTAADVWPFPDRPALFRQLVDVLNDYASRTDSVLVLHAGAVRTPDGRVLLLAGESDAGKSTLTGALVAAGCDYLGDEVTGIRAEDLSTVPYPKPLSLDESSRAVLGLPQGGAPHVRPRDLRSDVVLLTGDQAPIDEIVLPVYRADQGAVTATRLDPVRAVKALFGHTLNLGRAGSDAVATLCRLAEQVPVTRVEHDGALELAAVLVQGPIHPPVGTTVRGSHPIDDVRPTRHADVASEAVDGDQGPLLIVRGAEGPAVVLDPLGSALWPQLDGRTTVREAIEAVAASGRPAQDLWHQAVEQLAVLARRGLIEAPDAPWPPVGTRPRPGGPWEASSAWLRADVRRRSVATDSDRWARPWDSLPRVTRWWDRVVVATDSEELAATFEPAIAAGRAVEVSDGSRQLQPSDVLIEVRETAGSRAGSALRVGGQHLVWMTPGTEVEQLATLLANLAGGPSRHGSCAVAPAWAMRRGERAVLYVGELPARHRPGRAGAVGEGRWVRMSGMRIGDGRSVLVPDERRAASWLARGADPEDTTAIWDVQELVGLGVGGTTTTFDGWATAVDQLAPWQGAPPDLLRHLVAGGATPLRIGEPAEVVEALVAALAPGAASDAVAPTISTGAATTGAAVAPDLPQDLEHRLARLGTIGVADQSAKVDRHRLVTGRQLLHVVLHDATGEGDLVDTFGSLGLESDSAATAARLARKLGDLFIGTERHAGGEWRTKLYLSGIGEADWRALSSGWPSDLAAHVAPRPSWVAWKFASRHPGLVERSIDVPYLAGAPTLGDASERMLAQLPTPWADAVRALLDRIGVVGSDVPREDDALTLDEHGRSSIDIAVRRAPDDRDGLASELRLLAAVAGHDDSAADALVDWAAAYHPANVIFGTDRADEPFVNLYVSEHRR